MSATRKAAGRRYLPKRHAYPNPYRFPWVRAVAAALFSLVLFSGVAGALMVNNIDNRIQASVINTENLGAVTPIRPLEDRPEEEIPADPFAGRSVNILVSGIDSRYDDNGEIGAGTIDIDPTIRSDTTLVVNLSADRTRSTILSLPRDMLVDVPSCQRTDGSISDPYFGMFNSAFSTGAITDDIASGIACTQATVESFTGIPIDGFVIVDFAGFSQLVDTLGGVDMCFEEPLLDEWSGLDVPAGCQTLNGPMALSYARARKGLTDGSDQQRIGRQQELIGIMISQVLDSNMFTNLPRLYMFVQDSLTTSKVSPSLDSWKTDAALLNSIRNIPQENIRFVTVPWYEYPEDNNRLLPVWDQAWAIFQSMINDEPLPPWTVFKNLDGVHYVVGEDGVPLVSDEWGNPYPLDENGAPILPEETDWSGE